MENRIKNLMTKLDCTREEAIEIIKDDEAIDHGEKLFELTPEQKKAAKDATKVGTRKSGKVKRERKKDEDKRTLINCVYDFLTDPSLTGEPLAEDAEIINPEREIIFHHNGRKFKIVLSAPRT